MSTVVVTGAAGYIGGQCALQLLDAGHTVVGIDRRPLPHHLKGIMEFVQADFDSDQAYTKIIQVQPNAIIHCAGTSLVGPSIQYPSDYYNNNVAKTLHLLNIVLNALPKTRFIFSSSAATYGTPTASLPCQETDTLKPISPYGESKMMVEQILAAYNRAYGLDYVAFRYFNACGADPQGRHGQEPGATHIVARVLESIRDNQEFVLNGNNYDTPDGTCVRDYVHVADIAQAHVSALSKTIPSGIYNLGASTGTSNQQIIDAAEQITSKKVKITIGPAREGDPGVLVADADKFNKLVNWRRYSLNDVIQHAWKWYV
jgi:UDP-glucose-4-epimerase GalE